MGIEQRVKRWARRKGKDPTSYWELNKRNILLKADSKGGLEFHPKSKPRESPSDIRRLQRRAASRLSRAVREAVTEIYGV